QEQSSDSESRSKQVNKQPADSEQDQQDVPRPQPTVSNLREWEGIPELRPDTQTLLFGDSVFRGLHATKMSVSGSDKTQVVSVSGLDKASLLNCLRNTDPTDTVTTLVLHVGVNDCKRGFVIGKKGWNSIITTAKRCFPKAAIYMSSILPTNTQQKTDPCIADSNYCLSEVCGSFKAMFVDNDSTFYTRTGDVKGGWYKDSLHPNTRGTSSLAVNIKRAYSGRTAQYTTDAPRQNQGQGKPRPSGSSNSDHRAPPSFSRPPRFRKKPTPPHDSAAPSGHVNKQDVRRVTNHVQSDSEPVSEQAMADNLHEPLSYGPPHTGPLLYTSDGRPVYPYPPPFVPVPHPQPPPIPRPQTPPASRQLTDSDCAALFSLLQKMVPRAGQ
ncbi:hypothetical protein BaRGS_00028733, partial [Batillaria attramentaria]